MNQIISVVPVPVKLFMQLFCINRTDYTSENVIYLIACKKCNAQYVGQTHQKVSKRMNSHRFDILHYPESITKVSVHFNENGHSVDNFSFTPIDKVENEWPRLLKETYWMHCLKTLSPNGMNTKVLYQIPKTWNILFMSLGAVIPAIYIGACLVVTGICLCIVLACASAHFDRGIHWPFFLKLWAVSYPLSIWWELWSECADAWADIGLHWVYVTVVGVDVLRLILQSIFLHRKYIYKTVCHYFKIFKFCTCEVS